MVPLVALLILLGNPQWVGGEPKWFVYVLTCSGKIVEYWTKISLKIHLNQKIIIGKFGCVLGIATNPHWLGFNEHDLEIFRSKV